MSDSPSTSPTARIGVITFPGTLDDVDAARAVHLAAAREAADTLLSNPIIEDVVSVAADEEA